MTQPQLNQALKDWPIINRGDGRVEIQCPHGVGHPSHHLSTNWSSWMGIHGCDSEVCCRIAHEQGRLRYEQEQ